MKESQTVHLRKIVRPMRFLFLVPRGDFNVIKQVIRINTALWGGIFNPITYVDQSIENILLLFSASHSDGIINFTDQAISNLQLGLANYQVMEREGFDGLLEKEKGKYQFKYGCDMRPLMRFYWEKEGRFQSSTNRSNSNNKFYYLEGKNTHWDDYSLLEFGQYPLDHGYDYKNGYQKATNCEVMQIDESNISELGQKKILSPLPFTLAETTYSYYGEYSRFFQESMLFIGDINSANDWVEFWNSRCFYSEATFIHWDDVSLFEGNLRSIYEKQKKNTARNRRMNVLIQKSSSLSSDIFSTTTKKIAQIISNGIVINQDFHPIGISYRGNKHRQHGPSPMEAPIAKSYEEENIEYVVEKSIEFKAPIPEFLLPYMKDDKRSWCTAINSWKSQENEFWLKIPNLGNIEKQLRENFFFFEGFRISPRENIVLFPKCYLDRPLNIVTLNLPHHLNILKNIFEGYGIEVLNYSEKGRYAISIEAGTAQGRWFGANILLDRGVQAILNKLSQNNGEDYLIKKELEKIVGKESLNVRNKKNTASQIVDTLINRKILRIGLELKCENCYRQGWYHISQISENFKCNFCFSEQTLPIIDNKQWKYRSSGLFSSKHVGHGSLPIICLNLYLQSKYSHSLKSFYSFEIKLPTGEHREVDTLFIRHEMQEEPEIMICECKSGNEAEQKDFERLEELCKLIPGAIACLATWKDEFSKTELNFAQNFWDMGFEIIMLTRLDIESENIEFEGVDDQHKHIYNFVDLAHATRQKYLIGGKQVTLQA